MRSNCRSAAYALERIAHAVAAAGGEPAALGRAVVELTAEHLDVPWAILALRSTAQSDTPMRLVACDGDGRISNDRRGLPDHVQHRLRQALAQPEAVPADTAIVVPLCLGGAVHGVLVALPDRFDTVVRPVDSGALRLLAALATQVLVSFQLDVVLCENTELVRRNAELRRRRQEVRVTRDPARGRRIGADERRRLARDLHDGAAQQVLAVGLAIESCRVDMPVGSATRARLDDARRLAQEALEQVRSSIQSLSTGATTADEDLPTLLRGLGAFRTVTDFQLTVDVAGCPIPLTGTAIRSLFRIASECLFNTATHAGARRAVVRLVYGRDVVRLVVADDGHGDPEMIRKIVRGAVPGTGRGYHRGLIDVAARVDEMGGALAVERSDLGGVLIEVIVAVPLVRDSAPAPGGTHG